MYSRILFGKKWVFALFVWGSFPIAISSRRSGLSLFDKMMLYCNVQNCS